MPRKYCVLRCLPLLLASPLLQAAAQKPMIQIRADLTDAPRKLYHADIDLLVHPGPLALITPEWIPNGHGPQGPVADITGLRFEADGRTLAWQRDSVDTYEYHLEIPAGVSILHAHLDCIYIRATSTAAALEWEDLLLYPAHIPVREIGVQPTVTVPEGWGIGTSLKPLNPYDPLHPAGGVVRYASTTVEMLEDSPVLTGLHFHEYPLAPGVLPRHFLDVAGPNAESIVVPPQTIAQMSRLISETFARFGPPHYTSYRFLVSLQGHDSGGGLEHHESSDIFLPVDFFTGFKPTVGLAGVIPHEFAHSWNGKYRRPAGATTPDFATPLRNDLLWIYEGLTNYLGDLMAERIGVVTAEQYRQDLAIVAANMDAQGGRTWRSIEDTTFVPALPVNAGVPGPEWRNWRRASDYYPEGTLLWLEVDTTIRRLSHRQKSLDDFLKIFLQTGGSGVVRVEPYSREEMEADLNRVVANDWHSFFEMRVYTVQPQVNMRGIEQAGYRLVYTEEPTPYMQQMLARRPWLATWFSVGLNVDKDGKIYDVRVGSATDKAGLAPGQKITAINGSPYSMEALTEAIQHTKGTTVPIQLTTQDEDTSSTVSLRCSEGLRLPRLVRADNMPDLLEGILSSAISSDAFR